MALILPGEVLATRAVAPVVARRPGRVEDLLLKGAKVLALVGPWAATKAAR